MMVEFQYGALAENVEKQANAQGLTLGENAELLERLRVSINLLFIHDIVPDAVKNRMVEKLHKKVMDNLKVKRQ